MSEGHDGERADVATERGQRSTDGGDEISPPRLTARLHASGSTRELPVREIDLAQLGNPMVLWYLILLRWMGHMGDLGYIELGKARVG